MIDRTTPRMRVILLVACLVSAISPPLAAQTVEKQLGSARELIGKRDFQAAVIELKNALQREPNNLQARLLLAKTYLAVYLGAPAEKELRRAADLGAARSVWIADLGEALLQQGKHSELLNETKASDDLPAETRARVLAYRALALQSQRDPVAADKALAAARAADSNQRDVVFAEANIAQTRGDFARAKLVAGDLVKREPDLANARVVLAEELLREGKAKAAIEQLGIVLEREPWHGLARIRRISAYLMTSELEAAKADLREAEKRLAGSPYLIYFRGLVAYQERRMEAARDLFQQSLAKLPDYPAAHLFLGVLAYQDNQFDTADGHLRRYLEAAPTDVQAVKLLAATLIRLQRANEAVQVLEPIVRLNPDNAQLLALLGSAKMQAGDATGGVELVERAVELAPDESALRAQLALGHLFTGQSNEAETELRQALDLGTNLTQADVLLILLELKKKDYSAALTAARNMIKRHPNDPIGHNLAAAALLGNGNREAAREEFEAALKVDPKFYTAVFNLARMDVSVGELDAAEKRLRGVIRDDPKNSNSYIILAEVAEKRGKEPDAIDWLERAMAENPTDLQPGVKLLGYYEQQSDTLKALRVARQMAQNNPKNPTALRLLGVAQLRNADRAAAIGSFRKLTELTPTSPESWYLLGVAQRDAGDPRDARSSLEKGWELDPGSANIGVALANLYNEDKRYDDALKIARLLQQSKEQAWVGHQLEANTWSRKGDTRNAVNALEQTIALRPTSPLVVLLAQSKFGLKDTAGAEQVLRTWLNANPKDLPGTVALASLLHQSDRKQDAIKAYEQIIGIEPDHVMALNNLAWLYHEVGDDRSVPTARKALSLAPDRGEVADTLGWILVNEGRIDEGLVHLHEAALRLPKLPDIQYHIGAALAKLGRNSEARTRLKASLEGTEAFTGRADAEKILRGLR